MAEHGWLQRQQVVIMLRDFGFHIMPEVTLDAGPPEGQALFEGGEGASGDDTWANFPSESSGSSGGTAGARKDAGAAAIPGIEVRAAAEIPVRTGNAATGGASVEAEGDSGTAVLSCLLWVEQRKKSEYALLVWCSKPGSDKGRASTDAPTALLHGVVNAVSLQLSA
jgi:hypothetical protein